MVIVRWSLWETNQHGKDGKSRAQGSRHVSLTLMHGVDRIPPFAGSTTARGLLRVVDYALWSRPFRSFFSRSRFVTFGLFLRGGGIRRLLPF